LPKSQRPEGAGSIKDGVWGVMDGSTQLKRYPCIVAETDFA